MLVQLAIKDFALIDELTIEFHEQLNVLTGETGAGKSIIIDAVSMLLGARANSSVVRYGCKKAYVEGILFVPKESIVEPLLNDIGIELNDERQLILSREISNNGKSICRIDNRVVTVSNFREVSNGLINIYGQHDYQALSNSKKHIELLDSLGNEQFRKERVKVESQYQVVREAKISYERLLDQIESKNDRIEFLRFKANELEQANLVVGEDEDIEQQLMVLDNYEKIIQQTQKSYQLLYGTGSAYDLLNSALQSINGIRGYDPELETVSQGIESVIYQVEDYARTINSYDEKFSFNPGEKEGLEERKYLLDKIKKKYRGTIEEIVDQHGKIMEELNQLENSEIEIAKLEELAKREEEKYLKFSKRLSELRQEIAIKFEREVIQQLSQLAMGNTVFKVAFTSWKGDGLGTDRVEFLISPNPGQPLMPLDKIASGGEMSRIMLAFKVILAGVDNLGTLIFDEIDSGIGGNIVVKVAEKLQQVSCNSQVICVTHSPHIASFANNHYKIQKQVEEGITNTSVTLLTEEIRVREMARMLGDEGDASYNHAIELIKIAKRKVRNSV